MKAEPRAEVKAARKVVFHQVAENLYRLEMNGGYYGLGKRSDKQFRRSLHTKDRKLTECRPAELAPCRQPNHFERRQRDVLETARQTHRDSRHRFATACVKSSVDIPMVVKWLGHAASGTLATKS